MGPYWVKVMGWQLPFDPWGEAMSPPVLGTLMGLALGFILPGANGKPPLDAVPPNAHFDDVIGTRELRLGTSLRLVEGPYGLCGLHMWTPVDWQRCKHCSAPFLPGAHVFEWQNLDDSMDLFHKPCVVTKIMNEKSEYETLKQVKRLQASTDNESFLESLFDVEDQLTNADAWEIHDDSDVEPQRKARRTQWVNHMPRSFSNTNWGFWFGEVRLPGVGNNCGTFGCGCQ